LPKNIKYLLQPQCLRLSRLKKFCLSEGGQVRIVDGYHFLARTVTGIGDGYLC